MTAIQTSGGKVCEGRGCKDCALSLVSVLQRLRHSCNSALLQWDSSLCSHHLLAPWDWAAGLIEGMIVVTLTAWAQWSVYSGSVYLNHQREHLEKWILGEHSQVSLWNLEMLLSTNMRIDAHAGTQWHACLSTSSLTTFTWPLWTLGFPWFPYFLGPSDSSDSSDKPSTSLIQGPSSIRSSSRSGSPGAAAWDWQELNLLSPTKLAQISITWKHHKTS